MSVAAKIIRFPPARRIVAGANTRVPPLWQQVALLRLAQKRAPADFSSFGNTIVDEAEKIALQGEDAPIDVQIKYIRYCFNLMCWHVALIPASIYVEPERPQ